MKPPQEEQFFRRRLLQLGKKEVFAGYILICPWILILTNDNFAGKEEAADFYSFQGELVACLCVLSVIIITIIVNIANVMKIAVKVIVADNKYLGFFLSFFSRFGFISPPGKRGKAPCFLARSAHGTIFETIKEQTSYLSFCLHLPINFTLKSP